MAAMQKELPSLGFILSSIVATLTVFAIATIGVIGIEHVVIAMISNG
jgi:hypothetical protein